jgi:hypothetical protein
VDWSISTIHDSTMVDVPWRNEVKKKPICIFQYNMFMKGVDRADQYLSYYSLESRQGLTLSWGTLVLFLGPHPFEIAINPLDRRAP